MGDAPISKKFPKDFVEPVVSIRDMPYRKYLKRIMLKPALHWRPEFIPL
jgi:hypothetical protein